MWRKLTDKELRKELKNGMEIWVFNEGDCLEIRFNKVKVGKNEKEYR